MGKVECSTHGNQYVAFICQHLVEGEALGFWEPFDSKPEETYTEGELNGWCNKCDEVLMEEGDWNDRSESFANIQIVCAKCFFSIKKLNKGNAYTNG